jgi:excisionase family DNA binding protein
MPQQYYTVEEAAKVLQLPPDELREMAKKKEIRAFQDRGNWRFRAQDIDEEARKRGIGSEPDLQLGDAAKHKASRPADDPLAVDFSLEDDAVPLGKDKDQRSTKSGPRSPSPKSPSPRSPKPGSDSDVRLVMEGSLDFQIDSDVKVEPSGPKGSGSGPKSSGVGPKSSGSGPKSSGTRKSKVVADSGVRMVDKPSDSDVKVVPDESESAIARKQGKSPSDSDIRLESGKKRPGSDAGIITEEIDLDAEEARLAAEGKAPPPKPKPLTKAAPQLPTSSPFELSESDLSLEAAKGPKGSGARAKPKKDVDSSSDFELIPFDESKSPAELGSGEIPLLPGSEEVGLGDLPAPNAGNSGINLQDPADSGISLESGGSDELEFELSLDSGTTPKPSAKKPAAKQPAAKQPAAKEKPKAKEPPKKKDEDSSSEFELSLDASPTEDSSSEFELSLDESSETVGLKSVDESSSSEFELTLDSEGSLAPADSEEGKDIFEETNFEVPALEDESGSEAVAIDEGDTDLEGSDFEISLDESGTEERSDSQVVALEDEEEADDAAATVARPRKTKSKGAQPVAEDESELELDLEDVEGSAPRKKTAVEEEEEEEEVVAAAPAEWGAMPAFVLFPTVIVMFIVGLMGFEMVQGMWGYHRPAKVSKLITDTLARQFDESLPKD